MVEREYDKDTSWDITNGLPSIVTQGLTLSILGYPYVMPDMIGENEYSNKADKELFIRWAEINSFMPVMQYSIPPWRFDEEAIEICRGFTELHQKLGIYSKALECKETGVPIMRPLFFQYPEDINTYGLKDEFMIGTDLLVVPITKKGERKKDVYLPKGTWVDHFSNEIFKGGRVIEDYPAPLDRLPIFWQDK